MPLLSSLLTWLLYRASPCIKAMICGALRQQERFEDRWRTSIAPRIADVANATRTDELNAINAAGEAAHVRFCSQDVLQYFNSIISCERHLLARQNRFATSTLS